MVLAGASAQAAVRPYAEEVGADQPLAWYRLGDAPAPVSRAVADSGSGQNRGNYVGAVTRAPGIPGATDAAADFAGGRVEIENALAFDSGGTALTVEAWVQPDGAGNFRWVVGKDNNNTSLDYLLGMNADGTWRFITQGLSNDLLDENGASFFDGATWFHLVAVQDPIAAEIRLYVNGVKVGSKPIAQTGVTASNPLRIGARGADANQNVDGRIDEVALYKTVLAEERIAAHYAAGSAVGGNYAAAVTADAPFGWWRLGDAPEPTGELVAQDSGSAARNGLYQGTVAKAAGIPGAPDGAADFGGGYIDVDDQGALNSGGEDLTVEAWIQTSAASDFQWVIGKDDSNDALDYLLGLNPGGAFRFITQNLANDVLLATAPPQDGQTWYHVVGVQDKAAGTVTLYVNGEVGASKPMGDVLGITAVSPLRVAGRGAGSSQRLNGRLDEVAIYAKALSAERVQAHYQAGIYDPNVGIQITSQPRHQIAAAGDPVSLSVVAKVTGTTAAPSYQWKKDDQNLAGATSATLTLGAVSAADAGGYRAEVRVAGAAPVLSDAAALVVIPAVGSFATEVTSDAPFGWWRLGDAPEPVVAEALDSGSGNHDGVYQANVFAAPGLEGLNDAAADFAGGFVTVPEPTAFASGGTALTVEVWLQPDNAGAFRWAVAKDDNNDNLDYLLGVNPDGTFRFITQGLTHDVLDGAGPRGFDGVTWFHLAGVQDPSAGEVRLYVNGELAGSVPLTQTGITAASPLRLGDRSGFGGNQRIDGRLDEVAIYKTALSEARLRAHYTAASGPGYAAAIQADAPFAWWRLNDAPVKVVLRTADATSGDHDGTLEGTIFSAPGIPGAGEAAADFSGGRVDVDDPAAFDAGGGSFTVEAWVQPDTSGGWILGKDDNNENLDYLLGMSGAGFRFISQGLTHDITGGSGVFDGKNWFHVVAVQDATAGTVTLYVNGAAVNSTPLVASGAVAQNRLRIGARGADASQAVNGRIDEVAVYRKALAEDRVQAHYNAGIAGAGYAGAVSADAPDGWWRLGDVPAKPVVALADSGSGNHGGAFEGQVYAAAGIPGATDGAADFSGGYADIDSATAFDSGMTALTLEAWVQPDAATGWIAGKDDNNTNLDYLLGFSGSGLRFLAQGLTHDLVSPAVSINGTDWHHVVAVQDPGANEVRLYVDGWLARTLPISTTGVTAANRLRLGARGADANQRVDGRLDEVAIYKAVLSEARLRAHFVAGLKPPSSEVRLTLRKSGDKLVLEWTSGTLAWAPEITGPWTPDAAARSPLELTPAESRRFYRVQP